MVVLGPVEKDPWKPGIYFRGGDVVRPLGGQWFGPQYPERYTHFFCPWRILPFISVKVGRFGFYAGFKCFGVDRPEYYAWFDEEHLDEIYDGSNALCPSFRWSNSR